ncbi:hypothetical protein QJV38_11915 [Listeria cossartiae subsp. cayugensis]|uniref:Uncharacterized protein n=1 Tax=Listeria cossartiae subsp. cayugensis TaxID=2713505 RepID=A0ABU2IQE9_9LIST|nr:hypothetical protein [Listeria cossartiae]MDT0050112.1 hypothetical protein [Listeria cossartiae subsp. cayugensis]MDT0066842.1 hypothetical protein [Listeria cossartiae subsp. cayugensis]MDT0080503.1 hypothetical protein [Listeria cossartiae subsp. cayugensis]MDT0083061.1 hypothetical protein [Listeria cossartiae subsp. cayugensis]MDT0088847.1 hypothetical protein [Listeria cossartiae subsp. cayugensis]
MLFYKVVLQQNLNSKPLYEKLNRKDFLIGKKNNSFAIPYSPEEFNRWLNQNNIFVFFMRDSIIQALLTNSKFSIIISVSESLKLKLIDCQFENLELDEILEGEDFSVEVIENILCNADYKLNKVTFRSENNQIIAIKRNGVLELDNLILENEFRVVQAVLDLLNFGPEVVI